MCIKYILFDNNYLSWKKFLKNYFNQMFDDFKYLFAYTVPLATFFSIFSDGILTFITPIYTFIFIPTLEAMLKEKDSKTNSKKVRKNSDGRKIFVSRCRVSPRKLFAPAPTDGSFWDSLICGEGVYITLMSCRVLKSLGCPQMKTSLQWTFSMMDGQNGRA